MSQTSPRLALPYLQPAQAQKHVTHNEALQILDALVQLVLEETEAETPPASPALGAAYGLGAAPTGAWAGQAHQLAIWQGEGWLFLMPQVGWSAWDRSTAHLRRWEGGAWIQPAQVPRWGVATSADDTNRLAVAAPATLLSHAGAGHQLKVNKATPAETASLLFQSGFVGHAEIGLTGNTDLTLKTSADGSSWQTALVVAADSGQLGLGVTAPTARLELQAQAGEDLLLAGDGGGALFRLGADGTGRCAGAWAGGGADYAEYFEWLDGNPDDEDRRGLAVVLEADKIRCARPGESPIGVISARPCVIGNDDGGSWVGRWQRDAFGVPRRDRPEFQSGRQSERKSGRKSEGQQDQIGRGPRLEAPAFDPTRPYVPRSQRREWALVGLLGRLRLRAGQPVDPRWRRLGGAGPDLEDWLLR